MAPGTPSAEIFSPFWLALAGTVAVVAVAALLARRRRGWRGPLLALGIFVALRFLLLGNPWAWSLYERALDPDFVGWRQHDLIEAQHARFRDPGPGVRYLAVGSSQTEAVYGGLAETREDLEVFAVAAMMPMDFVLYAKSILRRRPDVVLLYLSDFDVAKEPSAEATVLAPPQGGGLISFVKRWRSLPAGQELRPAMIELAFGEILPEFKYRFVFRGLIDQQRVRVARRLGTRDGAGAPRSTEAERIGFLRESLEERHIAFNLPWLEDFFRVMDSHGVGVVVVEGHYNPVALDARTAGLRSQVLDGMRPLADRFDSVHFIASSELTPFTADEYSDLTHVRPEAGERFTREVLGLVQAAP